MKTSFNNFKINEEFNIFEDEHEIIGDPPKDELNNARTENCKFLIYTDNDGWFVADSLLKHGFLDSQDFNNVKQVSVITKIEEVKKYWGTSDYRFSVENLKPFDFIAKYSQEFI